MPPQPNSRAAWPSRDDNGGFFLIVSVLGSCVLAYLLWINEHATISGLVMALHHQEIALLRHVTPRFDLADRQMQATDPADVTFRDLYGIAHDVGGAFRIPAAILILMLALVSILRAAPTRYRRAFDLDRLIREHVLSFPTNSAFARRHLRLVAPSPDPRPVDYALTPEEWIGRYATKPDGSFDEAAARSCLALQLGPRWRGVEQAAPHVRAMFAVCSLHLAERRTDAHRLLGTLSASLGAPDEDNPEGPEKPLILSAAAVIEADAVLRDADARSPATAITARHGYTHTALMALLNAARLEAGVLAPGQFVWLKLVDRRLWYALHSLGFETDGFDRYLHPNPRIEAAGARDHWAAERMAGRPIVKPDIDRAIEAARKLAQTSRSAARARS